MLGSARGAYFMHLRRWRQFVPRSSLLVLQFDSLVAQPAAHLRAALGFFGLPAVGGLDTLPAANTHSGPAKVVRIGCETRATLARLYKPWNRRLYRMMARDAETRRTPAEEPPFVPFELRVPCVD